MGLRAGPSASAQPGPTGIPVPPGPVRGQRGAPTGACGAAAHQPRRRRRGRTTLRPEHSGLGWYSGRRVGRRGLGVAGAGSREPVRRLGPVSTDVTAKLGGGVGCRVVGVCPGVWVLEVAPRLRRPLAAGAARLDLREGSSDKSAVPHGGPTRRVRHTCSCRVRAAACASSPTRVGVQAGRRGQPQSTWRSFGRSTRRTDQLSDHRGQGY